jgi:ribosomal protein S18 acetylase RimI-like enzyme
MEIRDVTPHDRPWIRDWLTAHFASARIVSRGVLHHGDTLPGLVAEDEAASVGLLLYDRRGSQCEVVVLIAAREGRGVATLLLEEVKRIARGSGCRRLWLTTTNDNAAAIGFYERRGWTKAVVRRGAMDKARQLKPELPDFGHGGVPIRDEIEFELPLSLVDE